MQLTSSLFNQFPAIEVLRLGNGALVLVIDNFLNHPEEIVELAKNVQHEFVHIPGNPFPGYQLMMPPEFSARLDEFFRLHVRGMLNGRKSLHMVSRLSKVTQPPHLLDARQRICHRDNADTPADQMVAASVLYLFKNSALGGTVFFESNLTSEDTARLVQDASSMQTEEFFRKYHLEPRYLTESNPYFKVVGRVPAKWNRIIFYDGGIFHSSDITHPDLLNTRDSLGRLTVNGFFTCSRRAT